ncbi:hypothetical protein [Sphaerisporangium rhizosphaerae]|uniref:Aldehyde-activating protein n=1 Tax=Sphaerisporangium rhizosphaerae TaxID=2269375 RepID=A0ABW2NYY6_9ACTN
MRLLTQVQGRPAGVLIHRKTGISGMYGAGKGGHMADEGLSTIGRCYACKRTFGFHPARVMTMMIDPDTGLPPGMTVLGSFREPTPEATARSVTEPICPDCVDKAKRYLEFTQRADLRFETFERPDHR